MEKLTRDSLKKIIFEAFKDVPKGAGLGARECGALDDYASEEECLKVRAEDTEQHWWDYPDNVKQHQLEYAMTYNNPDGKRFHLPALMSADVDGFGTCIDSGLFLDLCVRDPDRKVPHDGYRAYVDYLSSFDIRCVYAHFQLTPPQVHAIALYLLWQMKESHTLFFAGRKELIETIAQRHESVLQAKLPSSHYALTLEDAIAIVDEEHRIVRDWLAGGEVDIRDFIFGSGVWES